MKICIISDTHNKHKQLTLPPADTIIHCGDFTSIGKEHEIRNFFKWYSNLNQYKNKIIIAGNHDMLFNFSHSWAKTLVPKNVHYLEDSEVIIDGIKFYGTPVSKVFGNWAFMMPEERLAKYYAAIPDDIDVLITHNPPHSILDITNNDNSSAGSPSLFYESINRVKPKFHCFGHIHEGYGIKIINDITFINASNLNSNYDCVNEPILIEI